VIAFFQMAGDAGMMVGPIVLGLIKDQASFQASFLATLALFLVSFVLVYSLPKRIPGNGTTPAGEVRINPRDD
jgi:MFS family permease